MATVNEAIADELTRHQVYLQRLSNGTIRKVLAMLKRSDAQIVERLLGEDVSALSRTRQEALLREMRRIIDSAYTDATGALHIELEGLATYEAEYQLDMFRRVLPVKFETVAPSAEQILAAVNSRPFQGKLLREVYTELSASAFRRVRDTIRAGFVEGRITDQIIRDLRGTAAQGYKDGILDQSRRSVEAVVRTATNHTANTAREYIYERNSDLIKGVRWNSTLDGRTTLVCMSRDGQVYKPGKGPRPPAHFNCLTGDCRVTASPGITGASKRWFDGEILRIKTAGGRELTCTPNHPVLTQRGWVAAGEIDFSDEVVCHIGGHGASAVNALDEDEQLAISDVAEAFFASRGVLAMPVPVSAPDFHGDGAGSKVAVVGAYRGLEVEGHARPGEEALKKCFIVGCSDASCLGLLDALIKSLCSAPGGLMRGFRKLGDFFRGGAVHAGLLLTGPVTGRATMLNDEVGNSAWGATEAFRKAANADAAVKQADGFFRVDVRNGSLMLRNGLDTLGLERAEEDASTDPRLAQHILSGGAFDVELDGVVDLSRVCFSGHVYNLETVDSYYVSNGIVTHNCRSSTSPVLASWREIGFDVDELPPATRASMNGQVPADQDYDGWLRKQPKSFQNEVLGKRRAELFRGGVKVNRFVDKSGREYTLDELRQREREAWTETA